MEKHSSPNVIRFPTFDAGLDDGDSNVISIFNAKPLPCDYADTRFDPYAGLEEAELRAAVEADIRRDLRYARWQRRVTVFCIILFYALLGYFSFRIGSAF